MAGVPPTEIGSRGLFQGFSLDSLRYFIAVNLQFSRCGDAEANLAVAYFHDHDFHIVADVDDFVFLPADYQHNSPP